MKNRILLFIILAFTLQSCHIGRFLYWNVANTDDYKKFENETIKKPEKSYEFQNSSEKAKLPDSIGKRDRTKLSFSKAINESETVALIIIKNDSILFEEYYENYTPETIHTSFSVAKSVISALIGIAISDGDIHSVDDPITNYLKGVNDEAFEGITIKHLLDMQSGLKFSEGYYNPFGDVAKYYYGRNLNKYITKLKKEKTPGEEWKYKSVDPQLLAAVLESTTGKSVPAYLEEKIWSQIGMESDASWSLDSKKHRTAKAFCCLNAIAMDYARFGRLYLNNGNCEGKQVIPESWVKESTTFDENKNSLRYSYQWWHIQKVAIDKENLPEFYKEYPMEGNGQNTAILYPGKAYYAQGVSGQFIYIHPEENIIIVRLGHDMGGISWSEFFEEIVRLN